MRSSFASVHHATALLLTVITLCTNIYEGGSFGACKPLSRANIGQNRLIFEARGKKREPCHLNLVSNIDNISNLEYELTFWTFSFATTHIGLSAIRDKIIQNCGEVATNLNLVNRGISLPDFWPGDDKGNVIFPDEETTGRQIYRLFYTMISFITLGAAFATYLNGHQIDDDMKSLTSIQYSLCLFTASMSFAASIASLFNASPLSLMPGFQSSSNSNVVLERLDNLKLTPKGLTRITRHPLILPVVPWAIASSYLQGGHTMDFIFFDGLALYAIAGCYAQDLRVSKQEGSVGTTFFESTSSTTATKRRTDLDVFFQSTSFLPFGAIADGRQTWSDVIKEFPLIPFLFGFPIGYIIESQLLQFLNT